MAKRKLTHLWEEYSDPKIPTLPSSPCPSGEATYRIFPIVGDSMLPILGGSDVVTQYVED